MARFQLSSDPVHKLYPRIFAILLIFAARAVFATEPKAGVSIEVDLTQQKAFLFLDGKPVYESRICSGRPGHVTPTGNFTVLEKDQNHFSTLYGNMLDASGKVIDWNADADMPVPKGGKFVPAPMEYFLRFDGANGFHVGIIKDFPASHGCVRLPKGKAILFYNTASIGTPVHIFGTPPPPPEGAQYTPKPYVATPTPSPTPEKKSWFSIRKLHS